MTIRWARSASGSTRATADYNPALRQVGNRLVGILYGCLKTRTHYDEATAWAHHGQLPAAA